MKFPALLAAVSTLAVLLAAGPALAQSAGIKVEASGGFARADSHVEDNFEFSPIDEYDFDDQSGGYGSISVGKEFVSMWDVTARFSSTRLNAPGTYTLFGAPGIFEGETDQDFAYQTLDIEVGYTPELDDKFDLRVFGGVRGLHYSDDYQDAYTKSGGFQNGDYVDETSLEYFGAGPRVGMDWAAQLGDSQFGISGTVAGAVIFGTEEYELDDDFNDEAFTDKEGKTIVDLEAAIGLDYHVTDDVTITAGYRAETLSDVHEYFDGESETQFSHGPFLKVGAEF